MNRQMSETTKEPVPMEGQEEAVLRFLDEINRGTQSGDTEGWLTVEQVREHRKNHSTSTLR